MLAILFAISWAGILVLIALFWLALILIRGLVDFVSWLYEVLVVEPRETRRRRELRPHRQSGVPHELGRK